jgi:hypothetical protein
VKTWKRRWMVIEKGELIYYKSSQVRRASVVS